MFNDQLLRELREQLGKLKEPRSFPVDPVIERAQQLTYQLIAEAGQSDTKPLDDSVLDRIEALERQNQQQLTKITTIEQQLSRLQNKIGNCTTATEVQDLIDASIEPLQIQLQGLINREALLKDRVLALEQSPPSGVTEDWVREIVDEILGSLPAEVKQLSETNIPRLDNEIDLLKQRMLALEEASPGEGATEAQVREWIQEEVRDIRNALKRLRSDLQTQITQKADLSALNQKADLSALNQKADKSELKSKADKSELKSKADKSELKSKADKSDLTSKADKSELAAKADQTTLDQVQQQLQAGLDSKADQSAVDNKADQTALDIARQQLQSQIDDKADASALESTRQQLQEALDKKADEEALSQKADQSDLETAQQELQGQINGKADQAALEDKADANTLEATRQQLQEALDKKADEEALEQKADQSALETAQQELRDQINGKADQTALDDKADASALEDTRQQLQEALDKKADEEALEQKADQSALETAQQELRDQINGKADQTALDDKADASTLQDTRKELQDQLDKKADEEALSQKADQSTLETAQQALQDQINGKADRSALDDKADNSVLEDTRQELKEAIDKKADQSALDEKVDQTVFETARDQLKEEIASKADQSSLDDTKTDLQNQIDTKADQSALEQKADQSTVGELEKEVDEMREEWLADSLNNPGARLARLSLQGWGIVGGFALFTDDKDYIHISPGVGVTPAGEMITESGILADPAAEATASAQQSDKNASSKAAGLSHCQPPQVEPLVFSHYVPLEEAETYRFFTQPSSGKPYEVWKLLSPESDLPPEAEPLTPQNDEEYESPFIADKVVLLVQVDRKPCYLLMKREDVLEQLCCLPDQCDPDPKLDPDYIYEEDYSTEDDYVSDDALWACLHPETSLPEIPLFRLGFLTDEECKPEDLDETEFPDITNFENLFSAWQPIIEKALYQVEKVGELLIERYHASLFPVSDPQVYKDKLALLSEKWLRFLRACKDEEADPKPDYYMQYFYDWMRDLIDGYHELRRLIIDLMDDLRPYTQEMLDRQHHHLLLGPAYQIEDSPLPEPLRDRFRQPPVYNGNARRRAACRLYFQRFFQLLEGFYLAHYAPDRHIPNWCLQENEEGEADDAIPRFNQLKITPSKGYQFPLSERSIPYYYPLLQHPQSLQHYWNQWRSRSRSTNRLLSYHATDMPADFPSYSRLRAIVRPLYYTLEAYDFYRIEGHIGREEVYLYPPESKENEVPYKVEQALRFLVQKHNLDFELLVLEIKDGLTAAYSLSKPSEANSRGKSSGANSSQERLVNSFKTAILGAEHLGGVPKGGTFILVLDDGVAAADFCLPYRCCVDNNIVKA